MRPQKSKKDPGSSRDLELQKLLEQALSQPGMSELLAVHEHWRKLEQVAVTERQLLGISRVISMSNTSAPPFE